MTIRTLLGITRDVLVLGLVSFFTDVSSEMIFPVLPLFFTHVLGASALALGTMEGLADFAASSLDIASGIWADKTRKRKSIAALGYGVSSASKVALLVAKAPWHVFTFRISERLGKSIRGAPRDALLAAASPDKKRGLSFGVHKAFDRAGAVVGPLIAFFILARLGQSAHAFHVLFSVALVPAFAAVAVLVVFIRERPAPGANPYHFRKAVGAFPRRFWHYLISASLFSLGYFSFAFLLLRANEVGFSSPQVAGLYALFNATFTLVSIPLGYLGDRVGRHILVGFSYLLYAAMLLGFLLAQSKLALAAMFVLYGIFYAIDEGQAKAFVTDLVPSEARATGLGIYGLATALAYLPASVIAGALWKAAGPPTALGFGAAMSMLALLVFAWGEFRMAARSSQEIVERRSL